MALFVLIAFHLYMEFVTARSDAMNLRLQRVTSTTIFIQLPCVSNQSCEPTQLKYKEQGSNDWRSVSWYNSAYSDNSTVAVHSLKAETIYDISATFRGALDDKASQNGTESIITVLTCPERVPGVTGLRVKDTGPGWIDVRWSPVVENDCYSDIFYYVRYGAQDGSLGAWSPFGVVRHSGDDVFRPTQPCAAWPGEFCALLTDAVTPGALHAIEVMSARFDPRTASSSDANSSAVARRGVLARLREAGAAYALGSRDSLSPCASPPRPPPPAGHQPLPASPRTHPGATAAASARRVPVPWWAVALAALTTLAAVAAAAAVAWRTTTQRRRNKNNLVTSADTLQTQPSDICRSPNPGKTHPARPVPTPQRMNSVRGTEARTSNIYDDCQDMKRPETMYERLKCATMPSDRNKRALPTPAPLAAANKTVATRASPSTPKQENGSANNIYMAMGPPPPIYDDARDIFQKHGDSNNRRSDDYVPPRQLPSYLDVLEDGVVTPGYNRPYSTMKFTKWKGWI